MKKTLLLSVVASTMIMAGGDIAPVEPVVETPMVAAASGWDFDGQAVLYYQTGSNNDYVPLDLLAESADDMFSAENAGAAAGIQLSAVNKDVVAGIGAGVELSGISDLGLYDGVVGGLMQGAGDHNPTPGDVDAAGAITQAYLTYGIGNTSIKVGRQTLPKALSPFAFSEGWNVFKNTFEAALLVNSDLPDTTLVGAYVTRANGHANLSNFTDINDDGVYMLTAQNKSIDGLTLTGSYYYAPDMFVTEDANILWGDAKFAISDYTVALQGGTVMGRDDIVGGSDTTAFGAKVGGNFGMFDASVAYSTVNDGDIPIHNLGTGVKTPLYTQMVLNQGHIKSDSDTFVIRAGMKALGGKLGIAYDITSDNANANSDYTELDLTYKTKITDNTTLFAAYVFNEDDAWADSNNFVRVWARYSF